VDATVVVLGDPPALEAPARLTIMLALVALNVIGVLSARAFEEQRLRRFDAERHDRHARQELTVRLSELAVEKERAESSSRARSAFLAVMSHEFRTPMNAIIGLADVLLDAPLAPAHRAHALTISDSARALLGLLEDILDFAKVDAGKLSLSPAPFDLRALAASVVEMLRPAAIARGLDLSLDLSPEVPPHLLGDHARLRQVLVNLVSNGVKFTERGAVTLRIRPNGGDHQIAFRVEDTGIGLTSEVIARLFRAFEQADSGVARRYGGTGLGLVTSKRIVAVMGGDIHVESEPGRGSVFSFTIRLAEAAPPSAPIALPRAEDRPPLAILVVDDHPINREVARAKLGQLGYQADLASDGPAAVEAAATKGYDVVLMDLQMPGMSGIEATARIVEAAGGERCPHVIAMTASVFEEDREACRRAGMRDFVGKPIDLFQLDAVLRRVADERGAGAPSLAPERLSTLRQIENLGEPRFFERLCGIFLADTRQRLPRMKDALARGDAPEIAREAHKLTAASATLGAVAMSARCAEVEEAARSGQIEGLGAGIDAISAQFVGVERALTLILARGPGPAALEAQ